MLYSSRFVKAEYTFGDPCQRDKPPNPSQPYVWGTKLLTHSYSTIYSQYAGFVGAPHFRAMCRLLGYQGIAVVVEELLKVVSEQVSQVGGDYICMLAIDHNLVPLLHLLHT